MGKLFCLCISNIIFSSQYFFGGIFINRLVKEIIYEKFVNANKINCAKKN
jgi:hypothetical protein